MLIAEGLMLAKDLQKKIVDLANRINSNIYILPNRDGIEGIDVMLAEMIAVKNELLDLQVSILKTNTVATVAIDSKTTKTIGEAIKMVDRARQLSAFYSSIVEKMEEKTEGFMSSSYSSNGSAVQLSPNYKLNIKEYRAEADRLAKEARAIEKKLIQKNWTCELVKD